MSGGGGMPGGRQASSSSSMMGLTTPGLMLWLGGRCCCSGAVNVVCADITLGREPVAIPAVNDVDELKVEREGEGAAARSGASHDPSIPRWLSMLVLQFPSNEFMYVRDFVTEEAALHVDSSPRFMCSCDCTDNCQNPMTCACAALMGSRFP